MLRLSALALLAQGRAEEAASGLDEAAAIATRVHAQRLLLNTRIAQANVARRLGRLDEILPIARRTGDQTALAARLETHAALQKAERRGH